MVTDTQQRIADADDAKIAWQRFVAPVLETLRADYMAKLTEYAERPMNEQNRQVVQNMSLALRVTREVESQMRALIADGEAAKSDLSRAGNIARLSPEERRYATY